MERFCLEVFDKIAGSERVNKARFLTTINADIYSSIATFPSFTKNAKLAHAGIKRQG
jgi:hypothetical protein